VWYVSSFINFTRWKTTKPATNRVERRVRDQNRAYYVHPVLGPKIIIFRISNRSPEVCVQSSEDAIQIISGLVELKLLPLDLS
jgi:hypothetical protein